MENGAENPFHAADPIFAFQQKADFAASHGAPQFRLLIVATVLLHVIATLIASAALAFDLHVAALPWVKLLCLVSALAVALVLHQHHKHHNWVRCRLAAEFCRSALATWGLPRAAPLFQDLDLPVVRGLTRALHILHTRSANAQPVAMADFKKIYLEKRIDDQLGYYQRQENRALPLHRRLKTGFWIATILAVVSTAFYAVCHTLHVEVPHGVEMVVFYFLPISLPIGIMGAVYLNEYGTGRLRRALTFFVDVMTGIPSIVAGLFAYALFALLLGPGIRLGVIGSVALAVLMIPIVIRSAEEILKIVPAHLREAAYALGTPKWKVVLRIVLPTALAGLVTGVMLAVARVIGETAPLLVTTGVIDSVNTDPLNGRMQNLAVYAYSEYKDPGVQVQASYDKAWAAALTLIVLVMALSLIARLIYRRYGTDLR
jgi:phosphate ABC transporter permease subunit PstA